MRTRAALQTPTPALWNGLTMRPDHGWAGNLCDAHLAPWREKPIVGYMRQQGTPHDAPCYVCVRQSQDPWQG